MTKPTRYEDLSDDAKGFLANCSVSAAVDTRFPALTRLTLLSYGDVLAMTYVRCDASTDMLLNAFGIGAIEACEAWSTIYDQAELYATGAKPAVKKRLIAVEQTSETIDSNRAYLPSERHRPFCRGPFAVTANCPECGEKVRVDLNEDTLLYPAVNRPFTLDFYHVHEETGDDHEFGVEVVLKVTIEATDEQNI